MEVYIVSVAIGLGSGRWVQWTDEVEAPDAQEAGERAERQALLDNPSFEPVFTKVIECEYIGIATPGDIYEGH